MKIALLALALIVVVFGQTPYEFTVNNALIYNDPIVSGSLVVNLKYDAAMPTTVNDSPSVNRGPTPTDKGTMSVEYLGTGGNVIMTEVTDFFFRFRFQYCPPCDAVTFKQPMPRFYLTSNGADSYYTTPISSAVVNGRTCSGFQHPGAATTQSSKLWVDLTSNPPQVCRHEWGNGKTIDFLTATSTFNAAAIDDHSIMQYDGTSFRPNTNWAASCNTPSCKVKLDVMIVLDESGSIDPPEWVQATAFVYNFFNAFTIGPDDVIGGVTKFAWSAELSIPLSVGTSKQSLLAAVSALGQNAGATCIGCGISVGAGELSANGRPNANNIIVVITDGYNNQQTSSFPQVVATAKAIPIEIFGIGVGGGFLDSTINSFVSDPIADHKFLVEDYSALGQVLNSVVTATCQEVPGSLCGAGCNGLCACANQCLCPPSCEDFNQCTDEQCTPGQNGNGCVYTTKDCNPNADVCKIYTCDTQAGCQSTDLDCSDGDPCTVDACGDGTPGNPNKIQCTHKPKDCADTSICTVDTCDSQSTGADPCVHTPVADCAKCLTTGGQDIDCSNANYNPNSAQFSPCNPFVCNPNSPNHRYDLTDNTAPNDDAGPCEARPVVCNDGNPCTAESCVNGACVYDTANFVVCNDQDPCTKDACDPNAADPLNPCVYTPQDPKIQCADGDPCTDDLCAKDQGGCYHTPTVCDTSNECLTTTCISNQGGCISTDNACVAPDNCHVSICTPENKGNTFDPAIHCVNSTIPGTINSCGVCLGNDVSCFLEGSNVTVYAITGGVIAAIVIAVVVAVALGVFGGKKGYDYFQNRKNNGQNWSKNNEIFAGMPSGSNPAAT